MDGRVLYPLFSFDTIFNTDVGIIKYLQTGNSTLLDSYYDVKQLKKMRDSQILSLLLNREDPNPLSILPLIEGDIDSLYMIMFDLKKEDILKHSAFTDLGYIIPISASRQFEALIPYIRVSDELEEKHINSKKRLKGTRIVHGTTIDVKEKNIPFDPYYINSYLELNDLDPTFVDKLVGKNIYISSAKYNEAFKNSNNKILKNNGFTSVDLWKKKGTGQI